MDRESRIKMEMEDVSEETQDINDGTKEIPDNITPDMNSTQIWEVVHKRVLAADNIKDLNDFLETLTSSNRYVVIRDLVGRAKGDMIKSHKYDDVDQYQRYQNLKQEAEESYKHDNTPAKLIDVDRACTNIYGILVRMIGTLNKEIETLQKAVNAVERETDIEPTDWDPQPKEAVPENTEEEISDDHNTEEDVQGE